MNVPKLPILAGALALLGGGFGVYLYRHRKQKSAAADASTAAAPPRGVNLSNLTHIGPR